MLFASTTTTADPTVLGRQLPMQVFDALIKAKPANQPALVDHRVRRDKIDSFGKVTLRYFGKLRHIPVGVAHKNRKVRLLVAGPDVRIITEDGELISCSHPRPNSQLPTSRRSLACAQCLATGVLYVLRQDRRVASGI